MPTAQTFEQEPGNFAHQRRGEPVRMKKQINGRSGGVGTAPEGKP